MGSQKYLIPWFVIIAGLGLYSRPGSLEDMREQQRGIEENGGVGYQRERK